MLKFPVGKPAEIYRRRVAGRKVLYFDNNIWIDLADQKTALAAEVTQLSRLAVDAGLLVCPVSYPAITELLKQGRTASSVRQAQVMDALSNGVSIRAEHHIIDLEVVLAHRVMCGESPDAGREGLFTAVACYVADGALEFPDGWTVDAATKVAELIERNLPTISWLLENAPVDDFRSRHLAGDAKYVERVQSLNSDLSDFTDKNGKLKPNALRFEEHVYVFKKYILPRLPRIVGVAGMVADLAKIKAQKTKPGPRTLAKVIAAMPSTALSCELHVHRRLAGRQPQPQDWYDQEHAVLGVPFSDAFATNDGELFDLLRKAKATERYGTRLLRGLAGVRDYLSETLDSFTICI